MACTQTQSHWRIEPPHIGRLDEVHHIPRNDALDCRAHILTLRAACSVLGRSVLPGQEPGPILLQGRLPGCAATLTAYCVANAQAARVVISGYDHPMHSTGQPKSDSRVCVQHRTLRVAAGLPACWLGAATCEALRPCQGSDGCPLQTQCGLQTTQSGARHRSGACAVSGTTCRRLRRILGTSRGAACWWLVPCQRWVNVQRGSRCRS